MAYNGEHALLIQKFEEDPMTGSWDNTWDRWHIAPSSRPYVVPAEPKLDYVDVPGADGSLDFTEILSDVRYSDRVGSWSFIVDHNQWNWPELYSSFMNEYQGHDLRIRLVDDPEYYYEGRISLKDYKQGSSWSSFEIDYHFGPYKWPVDSTKNRYWKWDDLFGKPVFFGPFIADTVNLAMDTGQDSTIVKETYTKVTKTKAGDNPKELGWYKLSNYTYEPVNPSLIVGTENPKKKKWFEEFFNAVLFIGINPFLYDLYELEYSINHTPIGYIISPDTSPTAGKYYYEKHFKYNAVVNPTGNPKTQSWYEQNPDYTDKYFRTTDTTVDASKTYYEHGEQYFNESTDTKIESYKQYYEKVGVYVPATETSKQRGVIYYTKSMVEVPVTKSSGRNPNEFVCRSLYNKTSTTAHVSLSTTGLFDYELYKYGTSRNPITGNPMSVLDLEEKGRFDIGDYEDIWEIAPGEVKLLKITSGVSFIQIEMADNKTL